MMRAIPASLVVAALCLSAWIAWDFEAGARVLMLSLVGAPLVDWFLLKTLPRAASPPSSPAYPSRSLKYPSKGLAGLAYPSSGATSPHTVALSLWLSLQLSLLAWALHAASTRMVQGHQLAELMLFVGMANGIFGMTIAHELLHRTGRTAYVVADALLMAALYGHFRVSHLDVHHRLVATQADPATPTEGETLYKFFGRSIVDGFALSLKIEAQRLAALGYRPHSLRNLAVRSLVAGVALIAMISSIFGAPAVVLFVGQALIAVYTLEALNYVQHYGLSRRDSPDAQITSEGSLAWDWDGPFTNWLMLDLGAHNEHHGEPKTAKRGNCRINPALRLPGSYLLMIAVASCPPLWRAIMDQRVRVFSSANAHGASARFVDS